MYSHAHSVIDRFLRQVFRASGQPIWSWPGASFGMTVAFSKLGQSWPFQAGEEQLMTH